LRTTSPLLGHTFEKEGPMSIQLKRIESYQKFKNLKFPNKPSLGDDLLVLLDEREPYFHELEASLLGVAKFLIMRAPTILPTFLVEFHVPRV